MSKIELAKEQQPTAEELRYELEQERAKNRALEQQVEKLSPKLPEMPKNTSADLIERARILCDSLMQKYSGTKDTKVTLQVARDYAFNVWCNVARVNPRSAEGQLDGPETMVEKYFRRKLTQG